jgi:hypothetical protein
MAYPPNYYPGGQPRYQTPLNQEAFNNNQQIGPPIYANFQEPPYYY